MSEMDRAVGAYESACRRYEAAAMTNIYGLTASERLEVSKGFHKAETEMWAAQYRLEAIKFRTAKDSQPNT
jgi:hypothetical protein